ncbi:hypothetical protein B0H16DRAFT_1619342 [Mycena metata]|uniref:Uncharacterized protein n=1 Tax=Mycena metata TaxID=1033252 RepID=A0AAD7MEP6_9AGAR|nr:hypothetical protein B0H16DRAFT_1619342 [Mycena metata]
MILIAARLLAPVSSFLADVDRGRELGNLLPKAKGGTMRDTLACALGGGGKMACARMAFRTSRSKICTICERNIFRLPS